MSGISASASTMAKPMRCVNEIFPPRERARWLLMTIRLSIITFAGTARTDVATGTSRLVSMFCTVRAATPRSLTVSSWVSGYTSVARAAASRSA